MNYLVSICLLLCAVTVYAIDFTKFAEKCCSPVINEFMQKEECKTYKLPDYLVEWKEKVSKIKDAKLMMMYFDKTCCALESIGVVSEENIFDVEKLQEYIGSVINDNDNIKEKVLECIDEAKTDLSGEQMDVAKFFVPLSRCLMCNCLMEKAKKAIGGSIGC